MKSVPDNLYATHKGFSLFELIVVVLIISLIGFLVFSAAIEQQQKRKTLNPTTLPSTFRDAFKNQGNIELFCINQCTECYTLKEGEITPYEEEVNLGEEVEIHVLDESNHFVQVDDLGRIKDKKICFRYHLYANGSTTQMVVVNKSGIYFLPSYFGEATKVADMQEAKALWIKDEYSLKDSGSFY